MNTAEKIKLTKQRKEGLVFKAKGIKIEADSYQYILKMESCFTTYHTTLAAAFEEIYERKEKENLIKAKDKSVEGIVATVKKTKRWLKELLKPLDTVYNK